MVQVKVRNRGIDKLAQSLLNPNVDLQEALEIISTRGVFQGALGKAISIFFTLFLAGLDWQYCSIIAVLIFFWDIGPYLLRQHRKAAAIAKVITLLSVGYFTSGGSTSTVDLVMQEIRQALEDGKITKEEFVQIIKDILKQEKKITIEKS